MKDYESYKDFLDIFDITENALEMRYLQRWNGRRVGHENLAEHTHLVVAWCIRIIDYLAMNASVDDKIDRYTVLKAAMIHDSLEILRGDILSITKRQMPQIGKLISDEENEFKKTVLKVKLNTYEEAILNCADSAACWQFIKNEMENVHNSDLVHQIYGQVVFQLKINKRILNKRFGLPNEDDEVRGIPTRFSKGYKEDAGTDIILTEDITFMPMSTKTVNLRVVITPKEGEMAFLLARTSAANKGLCVAMCPIDPFYTGDVLAIVHNVSHNVINYKVGEAFCQVVTVPIVYAVDGKTRKEGKRSDSNLGGTGA